MTAPQLVAVRSELDPLPRLLKGWFQRKSSQVRNNMSA